MLGETQFFVLMGDLRIEMTFMKCLGMYFWLFNRQGGHLNGFSKFLTDLWHLIKSPRLLSLVHTLVRTLKSIQFIRKDYLFSYKIF